jgi:hypothetical protein
MFKIATIAITAVASLAVASPGLAGPVERELKAKPVQRNGQTLYCVQQEAVTGSLMGRRVCQTKEEWEKSGARIVATDSGKALAANPQPTRQP